MTSIFFQISQYDFIEASKTHGLYGKDYGVRIVSFRNGLINYVYLPQMSLDELSLLATLLKTRIVPNVRSLAELQGYYTTWIIRV